MITGIGLDITELHRVKSIKNKTNKFEERILTKKEIEQMQGLSENRQIEFLAGRFAAKEAFSKAKGTGIGKNCSFQDIEIIRETSGRPTLYFKGKLVNGFVSITHTKEYAAAQVILES
ncbi:MULTISPECIES: holo-ACP synthase [Bacillaceae]|uniref:holo-ACP synthase n=1 Tax=Bacillaceae TaxID=186817 RepID=UPI0006AEC3C3|nr:MULTISPECIES: holo-ACP synthase [Bacillaceae]ALC87673.1 4'-phosphopantetheinyl transferase [Bacillus sp. FJAT-22090]KQL34943.1 4'-phosphopantetheinyl transferase [Psychrobacillus sp. FJAT-21963]MDF2065278.1 holo-ACP synthase [Bacillus sp. Cr_A10]